MCVVCVVCMYICMNKHIEVEGRPSQSFVYRNSSLCSISGLTDLLARCQWHRFFSSRDVKRSTPTQQPTIPWPSLLRQRPRQCSTLQLTQQGGGLLCWSASLHISCGTSDYTLIDRDVCVLDSARPPLVGYTSRRPLPVSPRPPSGSISDPHIGRARASG